MTSKKCNKCGIDKKLDEFYRDSKSSDGRRGICKKCDNIQKTIYYENNKLKICIQKAEYYIANNDKIRTQQTDYRNANLNKYHARTKFQTEIVYGRIIRPSNCSKCNKECKPDAHHWSYLEEHWLDVIFLCRKCHRLEHSRLKSEGIEL